MTQVVDQSQFVTAMKNHFINQYFARHDALELHLEAQAYHPAAAIITDIAGSAPDLGLTSIGAAASMVRDFLHAELARQVPDKRAMHNALNAFLDVSLEFCNPTGRHLAAG